MMARRFPFDLHCQLYEKEKQADKTKQVNQDIINLADVAPDGLKVSEKLARLYVREQGYVGAGQLVNQVLGQNSRDSYVLVLRANFALIKKVCLILIKKLIYMCWIY